MKPFYMKTGDTLPPLRLVLQEKNEAGRVIGVANLLTATGVFFNMINEAGEIIIDHGTVQILNSLEADVQYNWAVINTLIAGKYRGEFEVQYTGGGVKTYPNDEDIPIRMRSALA